MGKAEFPEDFAQIDTYRYNFPLRTFEVRAQFCDKGVEKIGKKTVTALNVGFCLELPRELVQLQQPFDSEAHLLYAWFDKPGSYRMVMFMTSSTGTTLLRGRTRGTKENCCVLPRELLL